MTTENDCETGVFNYITEFPCTIWSLVFHQLQPKRSGQSILFFFFTVALAVYGSSGARGLIGASAASLCHNHGDTR